MPAVNVMPAYEAEALFASIKASVKASVKADADGYKDFNAARPKAMAKKALAEVTASERSKRGHGAHTALYYARRAQQLEITMRVYDSLNVNGND